MPFHICVTMMTICLSHDEVEDLKPNCGVLDLKNKNKQFSIRIKSVKLVKKEVSKSRFYPACTRPTCEV